jgi:hypothetical protein
MFHHTQMFFRNFQSSTSSSSRNSACHGRSHGGHHRRLDWHGSLGWSGRHGWHGRTGWRWDGSLRSIHEPSRPHRSALPWSKRVHASIGYIRHIVVQGVLSRKRGATITLWVGGTTKGRGRFRRSIVNFVAGRIASSFGSEDCVPTLERMSKAKPMPKLM